MTVNPTVGLAIDTRFTVAGDAARSDTNIHVFVLSIATAFGLLKNEPVNWKKSPYWSKP
jgi:hypothetical protein